MNISIIIPTVGRPKSVLKLCECLSQGSILPDEVIIIEQGDVSVTRLILNDLSKKINLNVVKEFKKSASVARQRGSDLAKGDIVIFFDDDIEIERNYLEIVLRFFEKNPLVYGVTGSYTKDLPNWTLGRMMGLFFGIYSIKQNNIVLPSGSTDYVRGANLERKMQVEWLYGCNMALRKKVLRVVSFNKNFLKGSFGEDVMFSYEIHKKWPGSLVYIPELVVLHNNEQAGKSSTAEIQKMKIVYRYIFWKRCVNNGSITYKLSYLWSQIGLVGLDLLHNRSPQSLIIAFVSYLYIYKNSELIADDLINYNKFIFSEK